MRKGIYKFIFLWYNISCSKTEYFEAWLSLVERRVRDAEAVGSSPVASTSGEPPRAEWFLQKCRNLFFLLLFKKIFFPKLRQRGAPAGRMVLAKIQEPFLLLFKKSFSQSRDSEEPPQAKRLLLKCRNLFFLPLSYIFTAILFYHDLTHWVKSVPHFNDNTLRVFKINMLKTQLHKKFIFVLDLINSVRHTLAPASFVNRNVSGIP